MSGLVSKVNGILRREADELSVDELMLPGRNSDEAVFEERES